MNLISFRDFSLSLAHTYIAGLQLEQVGHMLLICYHTHIVIILICYLNIRYLKILLWKSSFYVKATATDAAEDKLTATEWCSRELVPVLSG